MPNSGATAAFSQSPTWTCGKVIPTELRNVFPISLPRAQIDGLSTLAGAKSEHASWGDVETKHAAPT
jgi:hypothetical protein